AASSPARAADAAGSRAARRRARHSSAQRPVAGGGRRCVECHALASLELDSSRKRRICPAALLHSPRKERYGFLAGAGSSSGKVTLAVSTAKAAAWISSITRGGTPSRASCSARFCSSTTLSGCCSATLVFSNGSLRRLKSSTRVGSEVVHTSFQSP